MILSKLDNILGQKLGADWHELELETISLEIGIKLDPLTIIKMMVLKALHDHPDVILNDADYFLRFVEIANGNVPDPHHHDIPTSLEVDFALKELSSILGDTMKPTNMLKNVVKYILNNEGHGKAHSETLARYAGCEQIQTETTKAYEMYASELRG